MAKCIGCGIKLQSFDEQLPGYVPQLVSDELNEIDQLISKKPIMKKISSFVPQFEIHQKNLLSFERIFP